MRELSRDPCERQSQGEMNWKQQFRQEEEAGARLQGWAELTKQAEARGFPVQAQEAMGGGDGNVGLGGAENQAGTVSFVARYF